MDLRIFSYLPNPRIWKATITARLCGITIDVRGTNPNDLSKWLWDFDAHQIADDEYSGIAAFVRQSRMGFGGKQLYKTDSFLVANPFGAVPTAFSPDGSVGIFESNSIMRAVARLGAATCPLYGEDAYSASRIDSFLDASLVFARDAQIYLLALRDGNLNRDIYESADTALHAYLGGLDRALSPSRSYLVGDSLSIADICVVSELALFFRGASDDETLRTLGLEPITGPVIDERYPLAMNHFRTLCQHEAFAPDVLPYLKKISVRP
ncbi:MAG: glutathione binding-like protein [Proteobacteria bacterium]|nr:glutathione binding-like protein [Pseudomonadota bacterium]MDA1331418.1 glutathione binding-like protein [Pseudomonadota bacterium]